MGTVHLLSRSVTAESQGEGGAASLTRAQTPACGTSSAPPRLFHLFPAAAQEAEKGSPCDR